MQKVFLVLFVGALGIFIGFRTMKTPAITNDLLLENVEALAEYENSLPIICDGSGSFSCPLNGEKYGYVYKRKNPTANTVLFSPYRFSLKNIGG